MFLPMFTHSSRVPALDAEDVMANRLVSAAFTAALTHGEGRRGPRRALTRRPFGPLDMYTDRVRSLITIAALLTTTVVGSGFSRTYTRSFAEGPPKGGPHVQTATSTDTTRPSFAEFLTDVRKEAVSRGIRQEIIDAALDIDEPLPIVIERDRAQAETVLSLESYLARRLTTKRIRTGREMLARHQKLLDEVAAKYGVPPRILVAIWGVESEYGRLSGIRPTITALATLAWDPRRSSFFRGELFDALDILNRGDIEFARLKGSWAGAMGQAQFMPSSYLKYAEDFDHDGRKDIWTNLPDVFASIGNYLKGHGWNADETWGREVTATPEAARRIAAEVGRREGRCQALRDMTVARPLKEWEKLGVRLPGGKPLPAADIDASLVSGSTRRFLVYRNYDALLEYNCANAYALGVALLAERIASTAPLAAERKPPPRKKAAPRARKGVRG
jgi:membrane-bound lytic murein transglycosylase B